MPGRSNLNSLPPQMRKAGLAVTGQKAEERETEKGGGERERKREIV